MTDFDSQVPEATDPEGVAHESAAPSGWLWLLLLYFRPRRFYPHFAVRPSPGLVALCAWIAGMSSAIDNYEWRGTAQPERVAWIAESWGAYWTVIAVSGVIGAVFYFAVGGWWYRVRLGWCGADVSDSMLVRRVYLFATLVAALPTVVATVIETTHFARPADAWASDSAWYMLLAVFLFWSCWTSYAGARSVYDVRRGPAVAWLLILPILFYVALVGIAAWAVTTGYVEVDVPPVNTVSRATYAHDALSFEYPAEWELEEEHEPGDPVPSVFLTGAQGVSVRVMFYWSAASLDRELDATREKLQDGDTNWLVTGDFDRWGRHAGAGRVLTQVLENGAVEARLFVTRLNPVTVLECQEFYDTATQAAAEPGVALIRDTLHAEVPYPLGPADVANARPVTRDGIEVLVPGNWMVGEDEAGLEIEIPGQGGFFFVDRYEPTSSLDEELDAAFETYRERYTDWQPEGAFAPWEDFTGRGRTVTGTDREGDRCRLRIWTVPLAGGQQIDVHEGYPVAAEELIEPGLRLLRGSLRIDGLERPAKDDRPDARTTQPAAG